MAIELPNKLTPLSPDEAGRALAAGYRQVVGHLPSVAVLRLLLAQWALETGNGSAIHNYNFGNAKHSSADQYFQTFEGGEVVGGTDVKSVMQWAAYPDPISGAAGYIKTLKSRPHWWAGLRSGSAAKYNKALSTAPKYYTAAPAAYLKTLEDRAAHYAAVAARYGSSFWGNMGLLLLGAGIGAAGWYTVRKLHNGNS